LSAQDGYIQNNLGLSYFGLEKYDLAIEHFQKAAQFEPTMGEGYAGLGSVYLKLRKYREAKESFNKALAVEPGSVVAHMNLGLTCVELKERDCALEQYGILQQLDPVLAQELSRRLFRNRIVEVPRVETPTPDKQP
jgi:tetratricopeptide (TPR) repeat protein